MQPSQHRGDPKLLRCPQCGAPLDAQPFALVARCAYCGRSVQLGAPLQPAPAVVPAPAATGSSGRVMALIGVAVLAVAAFGVALLLLRSASSTPAPAGASRAQVALPVAKTSERPAAPAAAPSAAPRSTSKDRGEGRAPLSSLLGIDVTVDIDGSREHVLGLFPSAGSSQVGDGLRYDIPLAHPWFDDARLAWKNEKAGKLMTVSFSPPRGDAKFKNQKEIADCLARGLGKPEVREIDHLAGELSYFWGKNFPKAWANLYSGYLFLSFQNPKGIAPVTLPQVVRTLDACTPNAP